MLNPDDVRPLIIGRQPGQYRVHCPVCHPDRKNKHEETLSLRSDGVSFFWQCWHCEEKGRGWIAETSKPRMVNIEKKSQVMVINSPSDLSPLSDNVAFADI